MTVRTPLADLLAVLPPTACRAAGVVVAPAASPRLTAYALTGPAAVGRG